jgi:hypothetical protein
LPASLFDKQAANFRGLFAFCAKRADFSRMKRRDILKRYHAGELTRDEALAELTALKISPKEANSRLGIAKGKGDLVAGSE